MTNILKKLGPLSNFEFNKLFLGEIFSHFSDGTIQFIIISILLTILPKAGSAMAILLFTFMVPQFLISPFAGALTDKFPRKWILSISSFYRFFLVIFIIVIANIIELSEGITFVVSFLLGIGAAFFYTAKMSIIPNIVEDKDLKAANAINSAIGSIALLFGAFLANIFISHLKPYGSLFLISIFYLLAGIILSTLNIKQKLVRNTSSNNIFADIVISIKYLSNHRRACSLVILALCSYFIVATFSNTLNSVVTDYYKLSFAILTQIRTMLGISIIVGMGVSLFLAKYIKVKYLLVGCYATMAIVLLTSPLCHSVNLAWFWLLLVGIAHATILVMIDTMLQKLTPDRLRGKIFGFKLTFTTFFFLVGTLLVAVIINKINPFHMFYGLTVLLIIMTISILLFDKYYRNLLQYKIKMEYIKKECKL